MAGAGRMPPAPPPGARFGLPRRPHPLRTQRRRSRHEESSRKLRCSRGVLRARQGSVELRRALRSSGKLRR
eukprot:7122858-Alexandrium_andersonii.AAC.1